MATTKALPKREADERILSVMMLLWANAEGLTREQIFEKIPEYGDGKKQTAGERMFERDKKILRSMGVPIREPEAEGEPYRLHRGDYRLPPLKLEPDEVLALAVAAEAVRTMEGLDYAQLVGDALRKMTWDARRAGLSPQPPPGTGAALPMRQRSKRFRSLLAELRDAVQNRKRIAIKYRAFGADEATRRELEPYALVYTNGNWQVVGKCLMKNAPRVFRVDRIAHLAKIAKPGTPDFERPEDFRLEKYVQRSPWAFGCGRPDPDGRPTAPVEGAFDVVLEVGPNRTWIASEDFGPFASVEEPRADGWRRVRFRSGNAEYIMQRVLDAGGDLRVVEPAALRTQVRETALAIAASYAKGGT